MPQDSLEVVLEIEESRGLRDKYLEAGVIGITHANDAHHVAICNHIGCRYDRKLELQTHVHYEKIRQFNQINIKAGYDTIEIFSPFEVI